ncbi:hypothetical protein BCR44DRAFT_1422968 [Catenaria anguillulae PL171]|uniref:Uncharacterized protein n=1 Tax=Catenaria anguillulae PL171 TaxID=765915 RepID=A0A1Y2I650_9FUNG|nr:hypothetical protein BCR44DRAFT_1422968 [Catenaria anguillulae PL171]
MKAMGYESCLHPTGTSQRHSVHRYPSLWMPVSSVWERGVGGRIRHCGIGFSFCLLPRRIRAQYRSYLQDTGCYS